MKDWQRDIHEGVRRENWSQVGPRRVVKVLPFGRGASALGGYITVGSSLFGKTPEQIERALGLKSNYLASGARIYCLKRLPLAHEYEYELTARYPGGLAFNPAHGDPEYLPGSPHINQWRIKDQVLIPVDPLRFLDLPPGMKVPYEWWFK